MRAFVLSLLLLLMAVSSAHAITSSFKRAPASYVKSMTSSRVDIPGASRSTMILSKLREPCRSSNECSGGLNCHSGYCVGTDPFARGEVGDACSSDVNGGSECLSGLCRTQTCVPSSQNPADNGADCGLPSECRSHVCRGGTCMPSASFKGLPGMICVLPADCVSNTCNSGGDGVKVCGFTSARASACAPLGAIASFASECCSNSILNGACAPVYSAECSRNGDCRGRVGTVCAAIGDSAFSDSQCCSGRRQNGQCTFSPTSLACSGDRDCHTGYCDMSRNQCSSPQGAPYGQERSNGFH